MWQVLMLKGLHPICLYPAMSLPSFLPSSRRLSSLQAWLNAREIQVVKRFSCLNRRLNSVISSNQCLHRILTKQRLIAWQCRQQYSRQIEGQLSAKSLQSQELAVREHWSASDQSSTNLPRSNHWAIIYMLRREASLNRNEINDEETNKQKVLRH